MKRTSLSMCAFCCVLCCLLAFPSLSAASFQTTSDMMLPSGGQYADPAGWNYTGGNGIMISNAVVSGFTASYAPPVLGAIADTHSLGAQINGLISTDSGQTYQAFSASSNVTFSIKCLSDSGSIRNFTTEMLQLDFWGGSLPAGVMIRESPFLHSTGQTSITNLNNGHYAIDSFFDVFTELTFDSGISWHPSSQSSRMEITPEPATLLLLGLGGMFLRRTK